MLKLKLNATDDISSLKDEFANYQKVSIVKNLNQQLFERNVELDHLKKKIEKYEEGKVQLLMKKLKKKLLKKKQ